MAGTQAKFAGRTLVVGLGKTGLSVVRFLAAKGETVAVTDSRDIPPGLDELKEHFPDVARFTGGFDARAFASADRLVISPGLSLKEALIRKCMDRGIPVIGDIELFAQYVDAPVIAITGSNGKTTVTTLVGEMAKADGFHAGVGGNIGTPALDLLDQGHDLYVLELSSFQLETTKSLQAVASVVLNISADHMDRYDSVEDYAKAKAVIYQNARHAVINLDDKAVAGMVNNKERIGFSLDKPAQASDFGLVEIDGKQWLCQDEENLLPAEALHIYGRHNIANALAALALGKAAGFSMEAMLKTLRTFPGLPHRTQFVAEINQVKFYNDSKATNVGSCIAALAGMHQSDESRSIVILGGDCKDADFSELKPVLDETCRAVILIGRDAGQILPHVPGSITTSRATDLKQAISKAVELAKPGDRVLLSPACASFDMFSGFEDRGNQFMAAVREMMS